MVTASSLPAILSEIANSLPVQQSHLDESYLAGMIAAAERIRALQGTACELIAREMLPARWIASETTIDVQLATSGSTGTSIAAAFVNSAFARRFPKQQMGTFKVAMKVRSSSFPPGVETSANPKEGKIRERFR